jgi:tetratricopeptide (TPR) repeat protein
MQSGDPAAAEKTHIRAIALRPHLPQPHNNLGIARNALGRYAAAEVALAHAAALDPRFVEAYVNWSGSLMLLGRHSEALEKARTAAELDPSSADALVNWGVALLTLGEYPAALARHEAAVRLDPFSAVARRALGFSLYANARIEEAVDAFDAAANLNPRDLAGVTASLAPWAAGIGALAAKDSRGPCVSFRDRLPAYAAAALAADAARAIEIPLATALLAETGCRTPRPIAFAAPGRVESSPSHPKAP